MSDDKSHIPPSIPELQVKLAVAIEHLKHLTVKVDERYEAIKRLHDRIDKLDGIREDIATLKVKIHILEKLSYTALALGFTGAMAVIWTFIQKFLM